MSAGVLSGFEFGPAALNPYEQFKTLKPVAVIDYGVFVYNGHFDIALAAALSHIQKADVLMRAKDPTAALVKARQAQALAPDWARVNETLGQTLDANGLSRGSHSVQPKALTLAKTVEHRFQSDSVAVLEQRLGVQRLMSTP